MIMGKTGNQILDGEDEARAFWNCSESTANGMFSWSGLHLDWCTAGCALYMMALSTADTVGMYAVLFLANSHVSPMSWQSLLNILLALSLGLVLVSTVPLWYPPFSCVQTVITNHIRWHFGHNMKK